VSELHKTFEVLVVEPGATLVYRPRRKGEHVLVTDREARLQVFDEDAPAPLGGEPFEVSGCETIARAVLADLAVGRAYRFVAEEPPGTKFNLFIEYPPAFGVEAWEQECAP
jgi:hypothetical protein